MIPSLVWAGPTRAWPSMSRCMWVPCRRCCCTTAPISPAWLAAGLARWLAPRQMPTVAWSGTSRWQPCRSYSSALSPATMSKPGCGPLPVIATTHPAVWPAAGRRGQACREGGQRGAAQTRDSTADRPGPGHRPDSRCVALGVTITAALLLGMGRQESARFSFLLSIPVIAGRALKSGSWRVRLQALTGCCWEWGAGVRHHRHLCIAAFLRLLDRMGLMPFVYYRVLLAAVLYHRPLADLNDFLHRWICHEPE